MCISLNFGFDMGTKSKPKAHPRWKVGTPKGYTSEVQVNWEKANKQTTQNPSLSLHTQLLQGKMF